MKKIKTFLRYLKEEQEKYYTLELDKKTSYDEFNFLINSLLPIIRKMNRDNGVLITVEPILESNEE
jgi:hypothetical protein